MLFPLQDLGVALQAESVVPQQPAHRGRRRPVPLPAQLTSQMPQRLGRPSQRRLRVASLIRLHQRRDQVAVQLRGALASPTAAPHLPLRERRRTGLQLEHARADRRLADPRDLGHGPDPAVPKQPGLSSQQQPPLTLVQVRQQHLEPHRYLIADSGRNAHTTTSNHQSGGDTLFLYGFTVPATFLYGFTVPATGMLKPRNPWSLHVSASGSNAGRHVAPKLTSVCPMQSHHRTPLGSASEPDGRSPTATGARTRACCDNRARSGAVLGYVASMMVMG